jgi:hypothetical protein
MDLDETAHSSNKLVLRIQTLYYIMYYKEQVQMIQLLHLSIKWELKIL